MSCSGILANGRNGRNGIRVLPNILLSHVNVEMALIKPVWRLNYSRAGKEGISKAVSGSIPKIELMFGLFSMDTN